MSYAIDTLAAIVRNKVKVTYEFVWLRWKPFDEGYFKLNTDGCHKASFCQVGAGGVIRNY